MYVPKLLALVEIVADPAKYNLTLPEVPDEQQFVLTDIGGQLDLALAAEIAGVDVDTIYQYNPGYNRWSTDPKGPHTLVLPVEVATDMPGMPISGSAICVICASSTRLNDCADSTSSRSGNGASAETGHSSSGYSLRKICHSRASRRRCCKASMRLFRLGTGQFSRS